MLRIWSEQTVPQEEHIALRMGNEYWSARAHLKGKKLADVVPHDSARVGAFRLGGEVHQWMYDVLSLQRLLQKCGFSTIRQCTVKESNIPNFGGYALDLIEDGSVYRPNSLYMEAQ